MRKVVVGAASRSRFSTEYCGAFNEPNLWHEIRDGMTYGSKEMQLSPEEGQLIAWLARCIKATDILEIGTGIGYSTLWLACALPLNGKVVTVEKCAIRHEAAISNIEKAGFSDRVEFIWCDAVEFFKTETRLFDLIFIDANKAMYDKYVFYADKLLKHNGVIIIDDILLFSDNNSKRVQKMKKSIEVAKDMLFAMQNYDCTILPLCHGLLLARKFGPTSL